MNEVTAAGERGCGFESSLEAWYRFLVDPAPPANVKVTNNVSAPDGVDQEVLTERKSGALGRSIEALSSRSAVTSSRRTSSRASAQPATG